MINPILPLGCCPRCHTHQNDLEFKIRVLEDESGNQKWTRFKSCNCDALTYSPAHCQFNLLGTVAEEYGIQNVKVQKDVKAVPPLIRRNIPSI